MKKLDLKSIFLGIFIGTLSVGAVSATQIKIKNTEYNNTKVIYNGEELHLSQPMITVINEGSQYGSNYMPVRAVLEAMDYKVDWDGTNNAVIIKNNNSTVKDGEKLDNDTIKEDYTQQQFNQFVELFDIEKYEDESKIFYHYIYKGDLNSIEFLSFLNSINNKVEMLSDSLRNYMINTDKQQGIKILHVSESNVTRQLYVIYHDKGTNTIVTDIKE